MITGMNHFAVRASDLSDSLRFYTEILGLKEAFRLPGADGSVFAVFLIISPGQYIELISGSQGTKRSGLKDKLQAILRRKHFFTRTYHISLAVQDIDLALRTIREKGGPVDTEIRRGQSGCLRFWTHDPDGTRIEILQQLPESMQAEAERRLAGD